MRHSKREHEGSRGKRFVLVWSRTGDTEYNNLPNVPKQKNTTDRTSSDK